MYHDDQNRLEKHGLVKNEVAAVKIAQEDHSKEPQYLVCLDRWSKWTARYDVRCLCQWEKYLEDQQEVVTLTRWSLLRGGHLYRFDCNMVTWR